MKTIKTIYLALLAVMLSPVVANAVPIVLEGELTPGVTEGGFINDPSRTGSPNDDFWSFFLEQEAEITLTVNRLNAELDPAFTLWDGVAVDTDLLTFLAGADDNIAELPGFAGPFSDPQLVITLGAGSYTVQVWDFLSGDQIAGGFCYQITLNGSPTGQEFDCGQTSVPEPGTLALLSLGLVGMAARRRKTV